MSEFNKVINLRDIKYIFFFLRRTFLDVVGAAASRKEKADRRQKVNESEIRCTDAMGYLSCTFFKKDESLGCNGLCF